MVFQQEDDVRGLCGMKSYIGLQYFVFSVNTDTFQYSEVECLTVCVFFVFIFLCLQVMEDLTSTQGTKMLLA